VFALKLGLGDMAAKQLQREEGQNHHGGEEAEEPCA